MSLDRTVLDLLNTGCIHPVTDAIAVLLTTAGLVALPALAPVFWRGGRRPLALALVLSQGAGLAVALVLQQLVARVRPLEARVLLGRPDCFSFPSGHAVLVFAAASVLARSHLPRGARAASLLLAFAVAASRVMVGHHWPSDVLAGAVLGVGLGLASHGLVAEGARGIRRWRWLLWPQVALVVVITLAAWLGLVHHVVLSLNDKALHLVLFGAVAFWLALWWEDPLRPGGPARLRARLPLAVVLPLSLALLEELAQTLSPTRTADPGDLACDAAGMVLGWLAARWLFRGNGWVGGGWTRWRPSPSRLMNWLPPSAAS